MPRVARSPSHAGSWYEKEGAKLEQQIEGWLAKAQASGPTAGPAARAIIAPHAGYSYCGHVMAHAYQHIDPDSVRRVFLLGPSHHLATRKCMLSSAQEYTTPLGALPIDQEVYAALKATGAFEQMGRDADEAEHSLELHTPYIAQVMRPRQFSLVPIMVGALTTEGEARYGALLSRYLSDPSNLFIISSDFCHWGSRFRYTFTNKDQGPIWRSIQWLDELGMRTIEQCDPAAFTSYLQQYQNTICGRHPIAVLLQMLSHSASKFRLAFNCYDQSSKATSSSDSSVSYATAIMTPL
ncbi:MEMO1 family [Scenedesmus sp. NREL 46B-D3]|nr:MEMO1 family [Scenedesmus sp. NREL 46B-D3]